MISITQAIRIITEYTEWLQPERVALEDALGRVLAQKVVSDSDLPPFNRAQMDGYAVRSADTTGAPVRLAIAGESAAGRGWHGQMRPGQAVRIMTGAPVPEGADSVQKVEVTTESDDRRTVEIAEATKPGQHIVPRAAEITAGTQVFSAGNTITAAMIAPLASFGYSELEVWRRPRVAVLATGSELVGVDERPGPEHIRDSNSYSLAAYVTLAGGKAERLPLAGDDPALLQHEIDRAADRFDMLILSGGVSMGVYDFTKTALRSLGAQIFFERVSLRPGKPTVFGRLGRTLVFGLPGNPVSVAVTFNLFARCALRLMQGAQDSTLAKEQAMLMRSVKGSVERESYLPARLETSEDGRLLAEPLKWGGSSDFVAFARATALINIPEGVPALDADATVTVVRLPG